MEYEELAELMKKIMKEEIVGMMIDAYDGFTVLDDLAELGAWIRNQRKKVQTKMSKVMSDDEDEEGEEEEESSQGKVVKGKGKRPKPPLQSLDDRMEGFEEVTDESVLKDGRGRRVVLPPDVLTTYTYEGNPFSPFVTREGHFLAQQMYEDEKKQQEENPSETDTGSVDEEKFEEDSLMAARRALDFYNLKNGTQYELVRVVIRTVAYSHVHVYGYVCHINFLAKLPEENTLSELFFAEIFLDFDAVENPTQICEIIRPNPLTTGKKGETYLYHPKEVDCVSCNNPNYFEI